MTHRQFEVWQAWLEAEWNRPSRADLYVLKAGAMAAGYKKIDLNKLKIEFKERDRDVVQSSATREQAAAESKARWAARRALGMRNQQAVKGR